MNNMGNTSPALSTQWSHTNGERCKSLQIKPIVDELEARSNCYQVHTNFSLVNTSQMQNGSHQKSFCTNIQSSEVATDPFTHSIYRAQSHKSKSMNLLHFRLHVLALSFCRKLIHPHMNTVDDRGASIESLYAAPMTDGYKHTIMHSTYKAIRIAQA